MACGDEDWENHVEEILFGYRTKVQESTKFSPFEVLYGFKAKHPVELQFPAFQDQLNERMPLENIRQNARNNISQAQKKQKIRFDLKHKGCFFKVGEKVWKYNARRDTRMGDKLKPR